MFLLSFCIYVSSYYPLIYTQSGLFDIDAEQPQTDYGDKGVDD